MLVVEVGELVLEAPQLCLTTELCLTTFGTFCTELRHPGYMS